MHTTDGVRRHLRGRWPLLARVGVILALVVCGGIWSGSAALADHPEGAAKVDCKGLVDFTSVAWLPKGWTPGADAKPRTNARVIVSYSVDQGKTWTALPWPPSWQFNAANNFTFSGYFQLRQPLPQSVMVQFQAAVPWANGGNPGRSVTTGPLNVPPWTPTATPTASNTAGVPAVALTASPVEGAPVAATPRDNNTLVLVAAMVGAALVIDVVAVALFFRRRRATGASG